MPAIELRDVHKTFRIPHEVHTTLTERLLSGFRGTTYERFEALRGVDLTIERGSFVGIIGGNGSGKSTLLKIISGLLLPDRGEVHVDGSMSALLELGLGFSAELTVRENVELYAAVLGYPRREVARRVDAAIEFAGLERFRDAKLKNLSTGMRARLGFATALQAESDIMLLDEILAVGDADFQLKCLDVFEELKQQRHDDRAGQPRSRPGAALLRRRRVARATAAIAADGDPDAVIAALSAVGRPGRRSSCRDARCAAAPLGRRARPRAARLGRGRARAGRSARVRSGERDRGRRRLRGRRGHRASRCSASRMQERGRRAGLLDQHPLAGRRAPATLRAGQLHRDARAASSPRCATAATTSRSAIADRELTDLPRPRRARRAASSSTAAAARDGVADLHGRLELPRSSRTAPARDRGRRAGLDRARGGRR